MMNYIRAGLAALLVGLTLTIKVLLGRNKELKHEIKIKDKAEDIRKEQNRVVEKVEREEHEKVEEFIENKPDSSRAERLNSVLNNRSDP